jgi:hypothetical protein
MRLAAEPGVRPSILSGAEKLELRRITAQTSGTLREYYRLVSQAGG